MKGLIGTDVLYRKRDAAPQPESPKAVFLLVHGLGREKVSRDIVEWADKRV